MAKRIAWIVFLFFAVVKASPSQTFTSLASFDGADGGVPYDSLVQGLNGNFYGTTGFGGANQTCDNGCGTVFEITPTGQVTTIYSFCSQSNCADGQYPTAGLTLATNGIFYGTTESGGANGFGTIFGITPAGQLTTLYSFCPQICKNGATPYSGVVQAAGGNFYGTTASGGAKGFGSVFEITPSGQLTTIYNFCSQSNCKDGNYPWGLVQAGNGNFYGTTYYGGIRSLEDSYGRNFGNIFEITPTGKLTVVYLFCLELPCADGAYPAGGLVEGPDGSFYGVTASGGTALTSCYQGCGTIFRITPAGQLTTLYRFCSQPGCSDGRAPFGRLVLAPSGNLYGITELGGTNYQCYLGCGTVFELTPAGLTTLHSFCSQTDCSDGATPTSSLTLATNGILYGTTLYGGTSSNCSIGGTTGCGTVFSISTGLKPFVETLPGSAKAGAQVGILGNKLTGATSVTFNGISTTFTVKSPTLIFANVPTGATTGYVTVTTSYGTLKSNVPFRVMP